MIQIDLSKEGKYHPLITATETILTAPPHTEVQIIVEDKVTSKQIKKYLIGKELGFREIYQNDKIILQFQSK